MKNSYGIYYLIIIFLIIMMFVPPIFRLLIPKEETATVVSQTIAILSCNKTKTIANRNVVMTTTNSYIDSNLQVLKLSYTKLDTLDKTDSFISDFETLKTLANVKYNQSDNSIVFNFKSFDFSKESGLSNYANDISAQKLYYESQGFVCSVTNS